MTIALPVTHDCDQECLARPSCLHEEATLQQDIVLAIAKAVVRVVPAFHYAPVFEVRHGPDRLIHPVVDLDHVGPGLGGESNVPRLQGPGRAFRFVCDAKIDPADWRARGLPDREINRATSRLP